MIKTILVPTDYSTNAHQALKYAMELAEKTGAKIILLHIYYLPIYVGDLPVDPIAEESLRIDAKESLETYRKEHASSSPNIEIECVVKAGKIIETIVKEAKERNIDMIIMGTKGASGISEVIFGSNTEEVIVKTKVPLLAIPENGVYKGISNIVFSTNYHFSDLDVIEQLCEVAKLFNAHITVVHIGDGEFKHEFEYNMLDSFRAKVKERISYENVSFKLIEGNDVYQGLNNFVHENKTDILCLSSHKNGLFNRLFGKSITKRLAYHTDIALLIFMIKQDDEITEF